MSNEQKYGALDAIDRADRLLLALNGQMSIVQECAEKSSGDPEYNDRLHLSIFVRAMVDAVRAALDDAAQSVA